MAELDEIIKKRRAYRALLPVEITEEMIRKLANTAKLTANCFNNQPWRFIFINDKEHLENFYPALSKGNAWAKDSSMIIVVFSKAEDDCQTGGREYYLFDTGMATAYLILKATDMGLVAHPMAGYDEEKTKEILSIPDEYTVITVIGVGKHNKNYEEVLEKDWQLKAERERPERKEFSEFAYFNKYTPK